MSEPITIAVEGLELIELLQLEAYIVSLPEVASVRWTDATPSEQNSTRVSIEASAEVVKLVAELHHPLIVAGAAGTAALSGFAAKIGSGLGELVLQWFKERSKGKHDQVRATLYAPDGTTIKSSTEKR